MCDVFPSCVCPAEWILSQKGRRDRFSAAIRSNSFKRACPTLSLKTSCIAVPMRRNLSSPAHQSFLMSCAKCSRRPLCSASRRCSRSYVPWSKWKVGQAGTGRPQKCRQMVWYARSRSSSSCFWSHVSEFVGESQSDRSGDSSVSPVPFTARRKQPSSLSKLVAGVDAMLEASCVRGDVLSSNVGRLVRNDLLNDSRQATWAY